MAEGIGDKARALLLRPFFIDLLSGQARFEFESHLPAETQSKQDFNFLQLLLSYL